MALNESAKVRRRRDFPGLGSRGADGPGRLGLGIRLHSPLGRPFPDAGGAPPSARRRGGGQYDADPRAAFCRSAHLGVSRGAARLSASFRLSCHRDWTWHPDLGRRARLARLAVRDRASELLSGRINERRGHRDLQSRRRNARSSAATAILALIPASGFPVAHPRSRGNPDLHGMASNRGHRSRGALHCPAQSTIPPASESETMIRFYFHPTPNPAKVALLLEEAGLPYEVVPVDTSKGEEHTATFRAINPNGKVPAITDTEGPGGREARVFDSTAILLYLAEKTAEFLGKPEERPALITQ